MKWITRSHVHVDRVACPWLICRFIDSNAEFIFAAKSQVLERAAKEGLLAFDTPGAEFHHEGDLCTFDVLLQNSISPTRSAPHVCDIGDVHQNINRETS